MDFHRIPLITFLESFFAPAKNSSKTKSKPQIDKEKIIRQHYVSNNTSQEYGKPPDSKTPIVNFIKPAAQSIENNPRQRNTVSQSDNLENTMPSRKCDSGVKSVAIVCNKAKTEKISAKPHSSNSKSSTSTKISSQSEYC